MQTGKDLFSGAVGGVAQVLLGKTFHLTIWDVGAFCRATSTSISAISLDLIWQ